MFIDNTSSPLVEYEQKVDAGRSVVGHIQNQMFYGIQNGHRTKGGGAIEGKDQARFWPPRHMDFVSRASFQE